MARILLCILFLFGINASEQPTSAITYALDCGRFGDQLINYIKALWLSDTHDVPLLYKPFSFSDQLVLSQTHPPLKEYAKTIQFEGAIQEGALHIVSYYAPFEDWEDETFRQHLKALIKPIKPIKPLKLPKGRILVAMHVRRGGGYDKGQAHAPTKFPPDSYYLSALKILADHFKGKSLYVHIFTDDRKPKKIIDKFYKELKNWGITNNVRIGGRIKKSGHDKNVLEDFFGMTQFACLIRPESSYSRSVAALSGPMVEIFPLGLRKDASGNPALDSEGNVIVDPLLKLRDN